MERVGMVELLKMMTEHTEIDDAHGEFYELAEAYGFCTPWCHLNTDCTVCKNKYPLV